MLQIAYIYMHIGMQGSCCLGERSVCLLYHIVLLHWVCDLAMQPNRLANDICTAIPFLFSLKSMSVLMRNLTGCCKPPMLKRKIGTLHHLNKIYLPINSLRGT